MSPTAAPIFPGKMWFVDEMDREVERKEGVGCSKRKGTTLDGQLAAVRVTSWAIFKPQWKPPRPRGDCRQRLTPHQPSGRSDFLFAKHSVDVRAHMTPTSKKRCTAHLINSRMIAFTSAGRSCTTQCEPSGMRLTVRFGTYASKPLRLPLNRKRSCSPQTTSVGTDTSMSPLPSCGGIHGDTPGPAGLSRAAR